MSFFNKEKKKLAAMIQNQDGKHVSYVTERKDGTDEVIGREGCIALRAGEFILLSSGNILFRGKIDAIEVSELMSRNGVVIRGANLEEDGKFREMTAHFVYHRK
jgi:hypothetical protein